MARKRYKTTVVRTLRQLGACEAGLQYVAGKTFDQAWEHCTSASFYIWWIRQVWVRYPDLRQRYFEDGHHNHVQIVTDALDTERTRSAELKVIHALAYEAPGLPAEDVPPHRQALGAGPGAAGDSEELEVAVVARARQMREGA